MSSSGSGEVGRFTKPGDLESQPPLLVVEDLTTRYAVSGGGVKADGREVKAGGGVSGSGVSGSGMKTDGREVKAGGGASGGGINGIKAVDNVSFTLRAGEIMSVVGESGSGKTALCRSIMRLFPTSQVQLSGKVMLKGKDLLSMDDSQLRQVWGLEMSIVFQDPMTSLNPVMRIGNQVSEGLRKRMAVPKKHSRELAISLLESVGIPDAEARYRQYPIQLSGGLRQRVAIAIAISCNPSLLILDEPTTGLDATIQAQIIKLIATLVKERSMAAIFVTHDIGVAASISSSIAVMYAGSVVEYGATEDVIRRPAMRYTSALLDTAPKLDAVPHARLKTIPGQPPNLAALGDGCPFKSRCDAPIEHCRHERPQLADCSAGPPTDPHAQPHAQLPVQLPVHLCACWNPRLHADTPADVPVGIEDSHQDGIHREDIHK